MPIRRSVATFHQRTGPITLAYQRQVASGKISLDNDQLHLGAALDSLYSTLISSSSNRFTIPDEHLEAAARYYSGVTTDNFTGVAVATAHSLFNTRQKGIYIHGSVGVGKSMLMDLFYHTCNTGFIHDELTTYEPIKQSCKRSHFHEFMLDVHQRIHKYKAQHPRADPIPPVAAALAREARVLCFDEMQIIDIADAMIMKRLLTILLDLGVTIVTTSNRPPCGLYEGGINRSIFLPFIDTLRERMVVIEMGGLHDYRMDNIALEDSCSENLSTLGDDNTLPMYLCTSTNPSSLKILNQWFAKGGGESRTETIPVAMGRSVHVKKAKDSCGWFNFEDLCNQPVGAADYIAIANRFDLIIIDGVPQLGGDTYNEARRFVTLIDALYEAKTKLIIAAEVPRNALFVGFDAKVETHDGDEEIAIEDDNATITPGQESFVIGEGGSSSSASTTMIHTPKNNGAMEWSATGRIGVSLAQLSAVREVAFSFKRAESRLAEMASANYRDQ